MNVKHLWLCPVLLICLCLTNGYAFAGSPGEEAIKSLFDEFAAHYSNNDPEKILALFAEGAEIKTGWPGEFVSKEKHSTILPDKMKNIERIKFSNLNIQLDGEKAIVKTKWHFGSSKPLNARFDLVLRNDRWLIIKQDY